MPAAKVISGKLRYSRSTTKAAGTGLFRLSGAGEHAPQQTRQSTVYESQPQKDHGHTQQV